MSCSTCERRQTVCDQTRPRCSTCKRVHLKCVYNGPPRNFSFQDETELVRGQATVPQRRRTSAVEDGRQQISDGGSLPLTVFESSEENAYHIGVDVEQEWSTSYDILPNPDFVAWEQDFYAGVLGNTSPGQIFPHLQPGITSDSSDIHMSGVSSIPQNGLASVESSSANPPSLPPTAPARVHGNVSGFGVEEPSEVPEHVLTQHYSLNAIHRPDSKSWNFYMHFYNRFASSHPPVLLAIYAFASAHLLYANELGSMARAISYYNNCLSKLDSLHGIRLPESPSPWAKASLEEPLGQLDREGLDVVIISFYFLALFDLMTTRPAQLRHILRAMPIIIRSRMQSELSGTSQRLSTWFLYLDTRASLFGLGDNEVVLFSIGDEAELAQAVSASKNVLQEEYSVLYPEEERIRDKFSEPLILRILEIMVIFREISRHTELADEDIKTRIRNKIDLQSRGLEVVDENYARAKKNLNYYYTIVALYNAVEIYYCRTFHPTFPLYSANRYAVAILTTTEKLHRILGKPDALVPHSKSWPIPLLLATIEVQDRIYRNWALRKFQDYRRAGNHYIKSCNFAEHICEIEDSTGVRANLGDVMKEMGEEFVV